MRAIGPGIPAEIGPCRGWFPASGISPLNAVRHAQNKAVSKSMRKTGCQCGGGSSPPPAAGLFPLRCMIRWENARLFEKESVSCGLGG